MIRCATRIAALPLFALVLTSPAAAQGLPGGSHLLLGAGLDYRYVDVNFYEYNRGAWERQSQIAAVAVEAEWVFPLVPRFSIAPGLGASFGSASTTIYGNPGYGPGGTSEGAVMYRPEVFVEGTFLVLPRLEVLARAGYGATAISSKTSTDWLRAGLAAVGARYFFSRSFGVSASLETTFAADGSSSNNSLEYSPSFENGTDWAASLRVCWRM